MTRDPQFGPMLMFGLGGIFVEVMKDVTFHLAPITAEEAMQMLKGTRSYALLEGRARPGAAWTWTPSPARCSASASSSPTYPQIEELDINPFIVGEVGTEAVRGRRAHDPAADRRHDHEHEQAITLRSRLAGEVPAT